MLRPEAVDLLEAGGAAPGNVLEGEVVDHSLQGATWRTVVAVDPETRILVQRLSRVGRPVSLHSRVQLTWRPEDMVVLDR